MAKHVTGHTDADGNMVFEEIDVPTLADVVELLTEIRDELVKLNASKSPIKRRTSKTK